MGTFHGRQVGESREKPSDPPLCSAIQFLPRQHCWYSALPAQSLLKFVCSASPLQGRHALGLTTSSTPVACRLFTAHFETSSDQAAQAGIGRVISLTVPPSPWVGIIGIYYHASLF